MRTGGRFLTLSESEELLAPHLAVRANSQLSLISNRPCGVKYMRLFVTGLMLALCACGGGRISGTDDGTTSAGGPAPSVCSVASQISCAGACIDGRSDPRNCGGCGWDCGAGACADGVCVCPSNTLACAGGCKDTASDERNCGACGVSCG